MPTDPDALADADAQPSGKYAQKYPDDPLHADPEPEGVSADGAARTVTWTEYGKPGGPRTRSVTVPHTPRGVR